MMEEVKKRILELEEAIQHLDFVKRHLNQNASEIKSQIHTSISRHLESLRNREVWLLGQVDTVLGVKEEVLHRQQARLNKALGILHSSLAHATSSDSETAAEHLVLALKELQSLELKAEETPHIAFRANHVSLRESILSYGRVDSKGLPLQSAFADVDKPSASLPRHLEEYEDTEHHVFYKTLQDTRTENAAGTSITVRMPKLSTRVEDWLQQPMLKLSASEIEVHSGLSATSPDAGKSGSPSARTTCSIQNWLSQIKHNPDLEEDDDFEIVDHSSGQRDSSLQETPDEEDKPMAEEAGLFDHISRDLHQWLCKGSIGRCEEEDLRNFFRHVPRDPNMWLATACRQLKSLEELKAGSWFHHLPTDATTWLRRAHDKHMGASNQADASDIFAHIPKDKSFWLLKGEIVRESPDKTSFPTSPVLGTVKDTNILQTGSEVWLNYYSQCSSMTGGLQGQAVLPGLQKYLDKRYDNTWLARPAEEMMQQTTEEMGDCFAHISQDVSQWLAAAPAKDSSSSVTSRIRCAQSTGDSCYHSRSDVSTGGNILPGIVSPIDSLLRAQSHMTISDWVGSPNQEGSGRSVGSWSTCSTGSLSRPPCNRWLSTSTQVPPCNISDWLYQKHL